MKNNLKYLLSSGLLLTSMLSCKYESFEEINTNPNNPSNVVTTGVFNSATKELMDGTRGSFSSGRMTLPWVQYSAQQAYTEEDRFQFREGTNDTYYATLFSVARDFKAIIDLNTDAKTRGQMALYGNNKNQIAASRVMLAYTFSILADTYGSVPYWSYGNNDADFQALQIEKYVKPKYASQQKIYTDILKELKEASEQFVTSERVFTSGDVIYNGDAVKWKKFANSLRLRLANRLNGVISSASGHITDAIASGVMTSNDDTASQKYENNLFFPSPMFSSYYIDARTDFKAANTFVDALKGEIGGFGVDPRLFKMIAPKTAAIDPSSSPFTYTSSTVVSDYEGMPYGLPNASTKAQRSNTSYWSNNVIKPDFQEVLMEYAEVEFLLSEVNGWDDTHYKNGVRASMERWGVASADIAIYLGTLPAATKANVLNQKYIAMFMQPQEAYSEWRRTGYPNFLLLPGQTYSLNNPVGTTTTYKFTPLSPSGYTLTEMPARLTYPVSLQKTNTEGYNSGVANLGSGGDKLTTKLIWDNN